jgi:hypothetical protein
MVATEYFVVTHDDIHFVGEDWIYDAIAPMLADQSIGCVCGEEFPIRLDTVEPSGDRVDITFGLSTWMWAARRAAVINQKNDFSFSKRGFGTSGRLEVWDQGGLWLEQMKRSGWRIAIQDTLAFAKWQHFENFDWTREMGDRRYAKLKHYQRRLVTALGNARLLAFKSRRQS